MTGGDAWGVGKVTVAFANPPWHAAVTTPPSLFTDLVLQFVSFAATAQLARADSHVTLNGRLTESSLTKPFDQLREDTGVTFHETPLSCASGHFCTIVYFTESTRMQVYRYANLAVPALVKLISLVTSPWRGATCACFKSGRTPGVGGRGGYKISITSQYKLTV